MHWVAKHTPPSRFATTNPEHLNGYISFSSPVVYFSMQDLFVQWHGHTGCLTAKYTHKLKQKATVQCTAAMLFACQDIRLGVSVHKKSQKEVYTFQRL